MAYDPYTYKNASWKADIDSFERWKTFFHTLTSDMVRERVQKHMRDIQQRWPQYIKESEIP